MQWMTFLGKCMPFHSGHRINDCAAVGFSEVTLMFQVAHLLSLSSIGRKVVGVKIIIAGALGHAVVSI